MRLLCNLSSSLFPSLEGDGSGREREREIDASVRIAVLSAIKASAVWLILSSLLGLIASIQLHSPRYLSEYSFLTYGKVYSAFWNSLVYGWLFNAGLACAAWILARLGGRPVSSSFLLIVSGGAWNLGVTIGVFGIFWGDQTPYRLLEFPVYAAPILLIAFLGIGLWLLLAFRARVYRSAFVSLWYLLTAVFAFAWIYSAAQIMLFASPAQGVFQGVVSAWYVGNLQGLVIGPMALATLYYLIPKTLGQPIIGYRQSGVAFWSWVAFSSCAGLASLVHGPFPAWIATVGVVASFGLFLPITVFSMQFLCSLANSFSRIWDSISARFVAYAAVAFVAAGMLLVFGSLRNAQGVLQFSQFDNGTRFLFLVGFAGMAFMGGLYFMLPRLLHKELPSPSMVDLQFWMQGLGIFAIAVSWIFGGLAQGRLLNGSTAEVAQILASIKPHLFISTLGFLMFLSGSFIFVVSFFWMLLAERAPREQRGDLLKPAPELEISAQ